MDSINANQPEHNHEDLMGQDAIKKIRDLVDGTPECFFCTSDAGGGVGLLLRSTSMSMLASSLAAVWPEGY
jgi:hypothetical protein